MTALILLLAVVKFLWAPLSLLFMFLVVLSLTERL